MFLFINTKLMIYELGTNGKSLYMSVEYYLNLTDDDITQAIAYNQGSYLSHPMMDTALIDNCRDNPDEPEEEEWINELPEENELFDDEDIAILMDHDAAD